MDKSGFEAEIIRPHGYGPIGTPCIDRYNWQGKKRINVIGALYKKALFALDYFEKNINGDIFYNWCKAMLIPSLKSKCVLVMDMSEDKAKHCFAQAQGESYARVPAFTNTYKDCSTSMAIAFYFFHLTVLI